MNELGRLSILQKIEYCLRHVEITVLLPKEVGRDEDRRFQNSLNFSIIPVLFKIFKATESEKHGELDQEQFTGVASVAAVVEP